MHLRPPLSLDPAGQDAAPAAFLRANSETYEALVAEAAALLSRARPERVMDAIAVAGGFAARHHPGRFADGALENLALNLGQRLDLLTAGPSPEPDRCAGYRTRDGGRRRVLHVAHGVHGIGGHTRLLWQWMQADPDSRHSLALFNQGRAPVPDWLAATVKHGGGHLVALPPRLKPLQQARWIRELARRHADLVVLHQSDAVAVLAFAEAGGPPVVQVDHADHVFWLGPSVADLVVNLRAPAARLAEERRHVRATVVLPVPLPAVPALSRTEARAALGIPAGQRVLLSIGRDEKYRPSGIYDFPATAGRLLGRYPDAHLYVIGETRAGLAPFLRGPLHPRLHLLGGLEDPAPFRAAADLYLESFPFGSHTALLEAAAAGLPVVPACGPLFPLLVARDDAVEDLLPNPEDPDAYIARASHWLDRPQAAAAFGATLAGRLAAGHRGEGWRTRLEAVYRASDGLEHRPRPLPATACLVTPGDIGLSLWHVMADGRTESADYTGDLALALLRHRAFLAKDAGDYGRARREAWRALARDPWGRATWRLAAAALLGPPGRALRRALAPGGG
jgi:glycosyltransferase involved in cell wall biosynthesis